MPFYVLFLLRAVHEGPHTLTWRGLRWGSIAAAAFFLVLIALVDWYYVMYVVLFTGLYGVYLAGRAWFGGGRTWADLGRALTPFVPLALIGGLFALVVSPLLVPTIQEARTELYMRPVPGIAFINSADLLTFFLPPLFNQIWGTVSRFRWDWPVGVQLYEVYFGYVALVLAGVGLLARNSGISNIALTPALSRREREKSGQCRPRQERADWGCCRRGGSGRGWG